MKRTAILVAVFFSFLLPVTAQTAPTVAGTWALAYNVAQISIKMTCAITQDGSTLAGACTGDDKVAHALTGTVNGQALTFQFNKDLQGTQITDTFTATPPQAQDGVLKGTMSVAPLNVSGTFTATKQ